MQKLDPKNKDMWKELYRYIGKGSQSHCDLNNIFLREYRIDYDTQSFLSFEHTLVEHKYMDQPNQEFIRILYSQKNEKDQEEYIHTLDLLTSNEMHQKLKELLVILRISNPNGKFIPFVIDYFINNRTTRRNRIKKLEGNYENGD